jgi:uncharacterized protein (TIGR02246 family)
MHRLLATVVLCAGSGASLVLADEIQGLQPFVDDYTETWNTHDARSLSALFAVDADMLMGIQPMVSGRMQIEHWWGVYFSRVDRGRLLGLTVESARMLGPDVAVVNVATMTGGQHSDSGEALESRRARGTWVVTRAGETWQIAALRAHSPVGELRAAPGRDR